MEDEPNIYADYKCFDEYKNVLLNDEVKIDEEKIPKSLKEIIEKLEECNKLGNYIDYQMYEDLLESMCKNAILNNKISEGLLNKLFKR